MRVLGGQSAQAFGQRPRRGTANKRLQPTLRVLAGGGRWGSIRGDIVICRRAAKAGVGVRALWGIEHSHGSSPSQLK